MVTNFQNKSVKNDSIYRADFPTEAVPAMRGYSLPLHRGSGYIVATPQSFNLWRASLSSHLRYLAGALRVVPLTRCAVVRERGLSSGRVGLVSGGYWRTRMLSSPCAGARVA